MVENFDLTCIYYTDEKKRPRLPGFEVIYNKNINSSFKGDE
jgi:hypothetical protein